MKRAFIFDMDGTMVDNMMVHHRAWQRKLAALGLDLTLEEVRQSIHGINEEILGRLFGDRFSPEERHRIAWEKEAEYRDIFLSELIEYRFGGIFKKCTGGRHPHGHRHGCAARKRAVRAGKPALAALVWFRH